MRFTLLNRKSPRAIVTVPTDIQRRTLQRGAAEKIIPKNKEEQRPEQAWVQMPSGKGNPSVQFVKFKEKSQK